jgi:hypothetical protein
MEAKMVKRIMCIAAAINPQPVFLNQTSRLPQPVFLGWLPYGKAQKHVQHKVLQERFQRRRCLPVILSTFNQVYRLTTLTSLLYT